MAEKEVTCGHCGEKFLRRAGDANRNARAGKPNYCSWSCVVAAKTRDLPPFATCSVDGCEVLVRSRGCAYCDTHYYQIRRNGYLGPKQWPEKISQSAGYQLLWSPDHRLSTPAKPERVYEHRAVFYAHHGEGPFNCHFCGAERDWDNTQIARLDDDKENNHIENLVASCHSCHSKIHHDKAVKTRRQRHQPHVTWQGKTQPLGDWAEELGFTNHQLWRRWRAGWTVDRMLTEPVFAPNRKSA